MQRSASQIILSAAVLLAAAVVATSCSGTTVQDTASTDVAREELPEEFDVQGHRGARGLKPENTLPAFETALDLRVTTLEFDLHFTADGDVVVWHDPFVDPAKCGRGPDARPGLPDPDDSATPDEALAIRSLTTAQLRTYACDRNPDPKRFPDQDTKEMAIAGSDYGIVTLDELLDFVEQYGDSDMKTAEQRAGARAVQFNMETKRAFGDPGAIGDGFDGENAGPFELRMLEVIADRGIRGRSIVQSFDARSLQAVHRADPVIRLAVLTLRGDTDSGGYAGMGVSIWSPKASTITEQRLAEAHDAGLLVIPWTVNSAGEAEALIDAGVDGLITDRPDLFTGRAGAP